MSISMNNLPNELLLKICRLLSINDFSHLSSTSRHLYQFGQNFREEIFNAKTRLVLSDRHNVLQKRLMKKCVDLCMEQSSEQATTDLPRENIAELTINLKGTNFEILSQFSNITQLIVVQFDVRHTYSQSLIPLLSPFPRLRMLKIISYLGSDDVRYRGLLNMITNMNLTDLSHLSIYTRKQMQEAESELFRDLDHLPTARMFLRLNEFYFGGTINVGDSQLLYSRMNLQDDILLMALQDRWALRRLGLYFDKAQTCFKHLENIEKPFLDNQITHLALHSSTNDYDTLTDKQLQQISKIFPGVQNFTPKALDDKIKQIKHPKAN